MENDEEVVTHTPGPWKCGEVGKAETTSMKILARKGGRWVSVLYGWKNSTNSLLMSSSQARANARLIAAAPDLLKALEDLCDSLGRCGLTESARDAINKATKE